MEKHGADEWTKACRRVGRRKFGADVASFAVGRLGGAAGETVVVNEIHYNPADSDPGGGDAEFIELHNPGTNALDVALMIQS